MAPFILGLTICRRNLARGCSPPILPDDLFVERLPSLACHRVNHVPRQCAGTSRFPRTAYKSGCLPAGSRADVPDQSESAALVKLASISAALTHFDLFLLAVGASLTKSSTNFPSPATSRPCRSVLLHSVTDWDFSGTEWCHTVQLAA